jgi:hypothetical protein
MRRILTIVAIIGIGVVVYNEYKKIPKDTNVKVKK